MTSSRHRRNSFFGVNISGPEFPTSSNRYAVIRDEDWRFLRRKMGVRYVRRPMSWEKMEPVLGGGLDPTELAILKNDLVNAGRYGIKVQVDLHNFGRWAPNFVSDGYPGQSGYILGSVDLPASRLVNFWSALVPEIKNYPALGGYGIMNEPHDLPSKNLLIGANGMGYPGRLGVNWFKINNSVITPAADPGSNIWGNEATSFTSGNAGGGFGGILQAVTVTNVQHTLSGYFRSPSGTRTIQLNQSGVGAGSDKTATTTRTRFSSSFTPAAGSRNMGFLVNSATLNLEAFADSMQLEIGASATTYEANGWPPIAQLVVDAIRGLDTITKVHVGGSQYSGASLWLPNNNQFKINGTGIVYEAHQYPDLSGQFPDTFDGANFTVDTFRDQLVEFASWAGTSPEKEIGEFGIPMTEVADPRWVIMLRNGLHFLKLNNIPGTMWFFGVREWQDTGDLNGAPRANYGVLPPAARAMLEFAA